MNRPRRRTNRKNHLNLPVRASIKAARSLFVSSARCFDNVSVRSARCCCRRALLPLFAGSQGLIQRGALLLLVFLSGCVSLEKSYPDRRYFALELAQGKSPNSTSDRILSVASPRISPRYADRSFIYRTSTAAYEADFYNQFLTAPDSMIAEELRKGLAASELFKYVVGPSNPLQPNYVLEGSINALYGDFRDPSRPAAVLEIEFFLYNQDPGASGVSLQRRYEKSVPLSERSPEALVKGWDQALADIVAALLTDLKAANL
jgi:cholesterol transport system auxiliary component